MEAREGDTSLMIKKITPVRLLINTFAEQIREAESEGADAETLRALLGKGRAKKGMMEGDLEGANWKLGRHRPSSKRKKPCRKSSSGF